MSLVMSMLMFSFSSDKKNAGIVNDFQEAQSGIKKILELPADTPLFFQRVTLKYEYDGKDSSYYTTHLPWMWTNEFISSDEEVEVYYPTVALEQYFLFDDPTTFMPGKGYENIMFLVNKRKPKNKNLYFFSQETTKIEQLKKHTGGSIRLRAVAIIRPNNMIELTDYGKSTAFIEEEIKKHLTAFLSDIVKGYKEIKN